MPVSDPILHAVVVEPDLPLRRALRRWLRTHRVHTTEVGTLAEGLAALGGRVDLLVAPGADTLDPGEPEVFGLDAILRAVTAVRALPSSRRTTSGLAAPVLPIVLTTRDPRALDVPPIPLVVRAPVPLHDWEFLGAAAQAVDALHDHLLDPGVHWVDGRYVGTPSATEAFAGDTDARLRLLTRLRVARDALRAASGAGSGGRLGVHRP